MRNSIAKLLGANIYSPQSSLSYTFSKPSSSHYYCSTSLTQATDLRTDKEFCVGTFYQFSNFPDYKDWKTRYKEKCTEKNILGTIALSPEGINGTLAGGTEEIKSLLEWIRTDKRLKNIPTHLSWTKVQPFGKLKIDIKSELVSLGLKGINPAVQTGIHVDGEDWDKLVEDPTVTLIDTRNSFEYKIGTFVNSINPCTQHFNEFPEYAVRHLDAAKNKRIAMFCTGGIRCEKASGYLLQQGFSEIYQLKGGIINYLEQKKGSNSNKFNGECFVFDNRVAINKSLACGEKYAKHVEILKKLGDIFHNCDAERLLDAVPNLHNMDVKKEVVSILNNLQQLLPNANIPHLINQMPRLLEKDQADVIGQWLYDVQAEVGSICSALHLFKQTPQLIYQSPEIIAEKIRVVKDICTDDETASCFLHSNQSFLRSDINKIKTLRAIKTGDGNSRLDAIKIKIAYKSL